MPLLRSRTAAHALAHVTLAPCYALHPVHAPSRVGPRTNSGPALAPALAAYFSEDDFLHGGAADSRITLRDCPVDLPLAGLGHVQFPAFRGYI